MASADRGSMVRVFRCGLRRRSLAVLAFGVIGLPGSTAAAVPPMYAVPKGPCATVRADGHFYRVDANRVSCSFAVKWASALAAKRLNEQERRPATVTLTGGPPGYTCFAGNGGDFEDFSTHIQTGGGCMKRPEDSVMGPGFTWAVAIPL